MEYRIGSFNLRDFNFSNKTSDNESITRDYQKIADIIIKEKFDVVALQEVNSPNALSHLVNGFLNARSQEKYEFASGDRMPTHSSDPERYAFIWNTARLALVNSPKGRSRIYKENPTYYVNAQGDQLLRPPYYIRFIAGGVKDSFKIELRLINVHIVYKPTSLGNSNDLLQMYAFSYLRCGATDRAVDILNNLVNESYNAVTNAKILSRLYAGQYFMSDEAEGCRIYAQYTKC